MKSGIFYFLIEIFHDCKLKKKKKNNGVESIFLRGTFVFFDLVERQSCISNKFHLARTCNTLRMFLSRKTSVDKHKSKRT